MKKHLVFLCLLLLPFIAKARIDGRGTGNVAGYVYDQDGDTPVLNAVVWLRGLDDSGHTIEYEMLTDTSGCFLGAVESGFYEVTASAAGYADTILPDSLFVAVGQTLEVFIIMREIYYPVNYIMAEEVGDDMVKVSWGKGEPLLLEDFETGNFTKFEWNNNVSDFPWAITNISPHQGQYCMKSTNAGQDSTMSAIQVEVTIPKDGKMSFFGRISSEQTWDFGSFYIDGVRMCQLSGVSEWQERVYDISQGVHVFRWQFEKDASMSAGDDCFYVDDIRFYFKEAPFSGEEWISYSNDIYYTNVTCSNDHSQWGCLWPAEKLERYAGALLTKVSLFSDSTGHVGGNYTVRIYAGNDSYPQTLLMEQQVNVPDSLNDYAVFDLTEPVEIDDTHDLWLTWSSENTAYQAATCTETDPQKNGTWWGNDTVWTQSGHGSWMTEAYVVDTNGRQQRMRFSDEERSLQYFNVWRRRSETDSIMIASHVLDSAFMDMTWGQLQWGTYQWGVCCTYEGNRGDSPIVWSGILPKDITTTAEFFVTTNTAMHPNGAEIVLTRADSTTYEYHASVDISGHYVFEEVSRGFYNITVSLDGYVSYHSDTAVSILEPVVFYCNLEEQVMAPESLYVSHTGWTSWTMPANKERPVVSYDIMLDSTTAGSTTQTNFQFDVAELHDGSQYQASVRAVFVTGCSEWKHYTWTYRSCDHFSGTQNGVSATLVDNNVEVTWSYPDTNVVGALVYRDGTLLNQTAGNTFIDSDPPFANQEADYCVRIIHDGPHDGTYYAMSCEECVHLEMPVLCDPPAPLRGTVQWLNEEEHGALISWGPKPAPINEWLHYDDNCYLGCIGSEGTLYWGIRFDPADLAEYADCALTQVALYDVHAIRYTASVFQGGETAPQNLVHAQSFTLSDTKTWHEETLSNVIPIDTSQPLWIVFSQIGYRDPAPACSNSGDPDGRWVSVDGVEWGDLGSNTWMIRCFVTNFNKDERFLLSKQDPSYNMHHFNLYRSFDNLNYERIATIDTVHGQEYYTYFDNYADETHVDLYYRLTAFYIDIYGNECESFPAVSELNPDQHYIHIANPWSVNEKTDEIRIFPVPVKEELHVVCKNIRRLTLFNAWGQVVVNEFVHGDDAVLNLSRATNGVFLLQISGNDYRYFRKIIISR